MAVFRVAAYLELFVEPHVTGFGWETYGAHHPIQKTFIERVIANGVFPATFIINAGLMISYSDWPGWLDILVAIALVFVGVVLSVEGYGASRHGRRREVEAWQTVRAEVSKSQSNAKIECKAIGNRRVSPPPER
jgi:hypothetical protein